MKSENIVSNFFDEFSPFYEKIYSSSYQEYHSKISNTINRFIKKHGLILDAGTGTGYWLEKLNKKGKVIGVDFSVGMLNIARQKLRKKKIRSVKLVYSDIKSLPFKKNYFDYILCTEVLRHIPKNQIELVLNEFSRVTKTNGIVILTMINPFGMHPIKLVKTYLLIPIMRNLNFHFNPKRMINPYDSPMIPSEFRKILENNGFEIKDIVKPWNNSLSKFFLKKLFGVSHVSDKWSYKYIIVMTKKL